VSNDQGKTWSVLLDNIHYWTGKIAGYQSKVLLASFNGAGIIKSTDNGKTWSLINEGLTDFHFKILKVVDELHYYVAADQGVFRTEDGGMHWVAENNALENQDVLSLFVNENVLLAGTNGSGVFKATSNANS
jgi:photosystem II stability/assembly factor-like uncharacterized protein